MECTLEIVQKKDGIILFGYPFWILQSLNTMLTFIKYKMQVNEYGNKE